MYNSIVPSEGDMDSIIYQIISYVCAFLIILNIAWTVLKYRKSRKQIKNARIIRIAPINRIVIFFSLMLIYQAVIVVCAIYQVYQAIIFESLLLFWLLEIGLKFWAVVSDDAAILKGVYFSIDQLKECSAIGDIGKKSIKVLIRAEKLFETVTFDKEKLFFTPHG